MGHLAYADLERTPKPCQESDFMGDVIVLKARQRRHFKFVYKRKIYLPSQFGESNDPAFERITYLQAEDEAINLGNVTPADQAAALELGAVSLYAALGDDFTADAGDLEAMDAPPFTDFLPPAFRETVNASQLVALRGPLGIAAAEGDEAAQESVVADLQRKFVRTCAELPLYAVGVRKHLGERRGPFGLIFWNASVALVPTLETRARSRARAFRRYGYAFFKCHRVSFQDESPLCRSLPDDITVAFGHGGLRILDTPSWSVLHEFGFADVCRWGGSSSVFSLFLYNEETESTDELKLSTSQAADMAGIILDYISAIMEEQGDEMED